MIYGAAKQEKTMQIMGKLANIEKAFKQMKASANLLCQQGNFCAAENLINKLSDIIK